MPIIMASLRFAHKIDISSLFLFFSPLRFTCYLKNLKYAWWLVVVFIIDIIVIIGKSARFEEINQK